MRTAPELHGQMSWSALSEKGPGAASGKARGDAVCFGDSRGRTVTGAVSLVAGVVIPFSLSRLPSPIQSQPESQSVLVCSALVSLVHHSSSTPLCFFSPVISQHALFHFPSLTPHFPTTGPKSHPSGSTQRAVSCVRVFSCKSSPSPPPPLSSLPSFFTLIAHLYRTLAVWLSRVCLCCATLRVFAYPLDLSCLILGRRTLIFTPQIIESLLDTILCHSSVQINRHVRFKA